MTSATLGEARLGPATESKRAASATAVTPGCLREFGSDMALWTSKTSRWRVSFILTACIGEESVSFGCVSLRKMLM